MKYPITFAELVQNATLQSAPYEASLKPNPWYLGFGNPNASILVLGKEKGFNSDSPKGKVQLLKESVLNPWQWKEKIEGRALKDFDPEHPYSNENLSLSSGHTWTKYSKLCEYLYGDSDFLKHFFISELNHVPSSTSPGSSAVRENVNFRLELLQRKYFKEQFKVVVLACGNYLKPEEIYNAFKCKYDGDETGKHLFGNGNWFYTHHGNQGKRLVVHTRQLSMAVRNEMLEALANIIRDHLAK